MRDIKFRAWCCDQNRMFTKVLVGNTTNPESDDYTAHCIFRDGDWYHSDEHDNVSLMQYTGLKDKNGVEIYEGDIVKCKGYVGALVVSHCNFDYDEVSGFYLTEKSGAIVYSSFEGVEVIGNIHQNPELLKQEK